MRDGEQEAEVVQKVIGIVGEKIEAERSAARKVVHKYVCGGKCSWYASKAEEAGFDRSDLTPEERGAVTEAIRGELSELEEGEARRLIHRVLCE